MYQTARVELICPSSGQHISQLLAGFALLSARRRVDIRIRRAAEYEPGPDGNILRAIVDGVKVVYDTRDHASFPSTELEWADVYFKRSFDASVVEDLNLTHLVRPLGLNYAVYAAGDWWGRRVGWTLQGVRPSNVRQVTGQALRLLPVTSLFVAPGRSQCLVRRFEQDPAVDGRGVLFLTRLWDPSGQAGDRFDARVEMNALRVTAIQLLRSHLGPKLVGGLTPSEFAIDNYPDLVVDEALTRKPAYIRQMRSAAVCIATRGLLDTNGWRLAEYAAASRAIVTKPMAHLVPGEFTPGSHYLTFSAPDELLGQVDRLLNNGELRAQMRLGAHDYYRRYVRPDALVANTLAVVDGL